MNTDFANAPIKEWARQYAAEGGEPFANRVHHCHAEELLFALPDDSIDLIATDPPYYKVKADEWDHQWDTATEFIEWIGSLCEQWRRVLKPNGSLYVFASPQMSARVEVEIGRWFNVLNRITWQKPPFSTKAEMFDKNSMRGFFPASESIIFAEQPGADTPYNDALIDGNSTYSDACKDGKRSAFGEYLTSEFDRAGATRKQIASLFPSRTGNLTGCVSNWTLGYNCPTLEQYNIMRKYLNNLNGSEYLRTEYEGLRTEYEGLRTEYEGLRRPFNVSADVPYTDVWTFATVQSYPGKHPAEKPIALMEHIIKASSNPGAVVLDCFAGSGTTLRAAQMHGRSYIGCDMSVQYVAAARQRLDPIFGGHRAELERAARVNAPVDDLPLFRSAND